MDSIDKSADHLKALQILIRCSEADYISTQDSRFIELRDSYVQMQCDVLWFYRDLHKEQALITECEQA